MTDLKLTLHYRDAEKTDHHIHIGKAALSIGRDPNGEIVLENERVTRAHCEIRFWGGDYILKDLHSKNGTYLNDTLVNVAILQVNDVIGVGPFSLSVLDESAREMGETQAGEVLKEMNEGKGFNTILHQIVDDLDKDA